MSCVPIALFGGPFVPSLGLVEVAVHAFAAAVAESYRKLCVAESLFCRFEEPLKAEALILRHTATVSVRHAERVFAFGIALFRGQLEK